MDCGVKSSGHERFASRSAWSFPRPRPPAGGFAVDHTTSSLPPPRNNAVPLLCALSFQRPQHHCLYVFFSFPSASLTHNSCDTFPFPFLEIDFHRFPPCTKIFLRRSVFRRQPSTISPIVGSIFLSYHDGGSQQLYSDSDTSRRWLP